jgi:predicted phage terminase large subunit-like protein
MKNTLSKKEIDIKYKGFTDLFYLTKHILGYSELIESYHEPLCKFTQIQQSDLDLEPRGHFKTTIRSIGYSIQLILNNPNVRILINHKILGKARDILREIKGHFEKNKKLIYFYGDRRGETWGTDSIIVKRDKILKEPTISIGSPDHEATSGHYDYILNDDLVGLKDMVSQAERDKTLRYYKTLPYLKEPTGHIKNTGTRWNLDDLYNYLINQRSLVVRVKKAVENEIPIFPERFTLEALKKMENDDPIMYEAQMMNNPTAMKDQLYSLDKLQLFDMESFKPTYNIAYIDPAFGERESKEPCFFSFPIASIVNDKAYMIDWNCNRSDPAENENLVVSKCIEHKIQRLGIEGNVAQSEFARSVQKKLRENNIVLNIENIINTQNKDRRIQSAHGSITNNVLFRKDWEKRYPEAMRQLTLYPYHKFKDAPDSLAGLVYMFTSHNPVRMRYI